MEFARKIFLRLCIALFRFYRLSLRSPQSVLAVAGVVLLFGFVGLSKTRTLFAVHDVGDPTLKVAEKFKQVREDFDMGSSMLILFRPSAGSNLSHQTLEEVWRWIAVEDSTNDHLLRVFSPFDLRKPEVEGEKMWYPRLLQNNLPEELAQVVDTPWSGILTNPKTHDLAVEFTFQGVKSSQFYGSFDPSPVGELLGRLAQFAEKFKAEGVRYFVAGEAVFQYFCHEGINRNHLLNLVMLILFLITFRILFGTWRSGLVYVMTLSFMAIVTYGSMAWLGFPIDLISSGLILMMAVAALEDYLFICYEQLQHGTSWKKTVRPILLASFCTSLTTMVGFGSLYTTDMLIMARFGLWAAFGSLVQWIACFIILPALMEKFPYFRKLAEPKKAFRPDIPENLLKIPLSRNVARALLIIFPVGMYSLFHLHISGAPKDMMTKSHPFIQGLGELRSSRGWEGVVHIVFQSPMDRAAKVEVLEHLRSLPNVEQVLSLEGIQDFAVKDITALRKDLVLSDLETTELFKSYFSRSGASRATLYVKDTATEPMMKLLSGIEQECQGRCFGVSETAAHAEFSAKVPEAFIESFGSSMIMVSLILLALVRFLTKPPRPYFSILASSMWGPFFVLTLFWLFNTKINFMACLFTNVLIGLTGDNAIQFLFTSRKQNINMGLNRRGGGSLLISMIICMSCMVFWGSYFVSPRVYGMFLAVGILAATFGDVWILKAFHQEEAKD